MAKVDLLVLTAANQAQARGYAAQLQAREAQHAMPGDAPWRVVPDPGGHRVGSGGSTLAVLAQLAGELLKRNPEARNLAELFHQQRIIIIHSGGDSRRLCSYAAQGKVFTPLPCNTPQRRPATLFDLIAQSLIDLPAPPTGQVLIASGDVLLTFHRSEIDFNRPGVVGVAYPGPIERGRQHGVYVAGDHGKVTDFLQKPDLTEARDRHAIDPVGRMLIDTGLLSLDPPTIRRMLEAAGVQLRRGKLVQGPGLLRDVCAGKTPPLDLYEQMLMAMPSRINERRYLQLVTKPDTPARYVRQLLALRQTLRRGDFQVNVLPYCEFFHIGTSRELLANVSTLGRTSRLYGFENFSRAVVADQAAMEGAFVYNSVLESRSLRAGQGVLVEATHSSAPMELAGQNIVVGYPPQARGKLKLPKGWALTCVPVGERDWAAILFGVEDDFKTSRAAGGTVGNIALDDFCKAKKIDPAALWTHADAAKQTLWDARFWCVGPIETVLEQTIWMTRRKPAPPAWLKANRINMASLLKMVNHARLIAHRDRVFQVGDLKRLGETLKADRWLPAASVLAMLENAGQAREAIARIDDLLDRDTDALDQARLHRLKQLIREKFQSRQKAAIAADEAASFQAVSQSVAQQIELPDKPRPAAILPDQVVWVTTPVRLDFAGGWSDTPPICNEMGGAVVNAAITLNRQYPVQVMAKLADEPRITLSSIDLGRRIELTTARQVQGFHDMGDWAALPKAALILAGLCPKDPEASLSRWLEKLGGGLDITLFSALPKGSGLGTSSVLGAAMLACLSRIVGEPVSHETIVERTSMLEQLMTTGGGWQDQVGGILPGVKFIRTEPGPRQTPMLAWTAFDAQRQLGDRLLLYYTGYKRLARNILQKVVGRYLARDPQAVKLIDQLKDAAVRMKHDLDAGDAEAFGRGIEDYWSYKKSLDPGSTNPRIDKLIQRVDRYLVGKVLPGAGGGGFVFMVARDPDAAAKVRKMLEADPPNRLARFFDFDIDPKGLEVTVL